MAGQLDINTPPLPAMNPANALADDILVYVGRMGGDAAYRVRAEDFYKVATKASVALRPTLPSNASTWTAAQIVAYLQGTGQIRPNPPFGPADVANIVGLWDMDAAHTFQDASDTVPGVPGSAFRKAKNQVGSVDLVQTVGTKQPVLTTYGSYTAAHFDGVDDFLSGLLPAYTDFELWVVYAWDLPINSVGAVQGGILGREGDGSTTARYNLSPQNNGVGRVTWTTYNTTNTATVNDSRTRAANAWSLARVRYTNTGGTTTLTYSTPTIGTPLTASASSTVNEAATDTFYLGYGGSAVGGSHQGPVATLMQFNGGVSSGDASNLMTYLTAKYGSLI